MMDAYGMVPTQYCIPMMVTFGESDVCFSWRRGRVKTHVRSTADVSTADVSTADVNWFSLCVFLNSDFLYYGLEPIASQRTKSHIITNTHCWKSCIRHIRRVWMEERSGKNCGWSVPKNLFIRKSNKNIIFGKRSRNGLLGVRCTFFALRMQVFSCTREVGMENLWEKPQVLLKCWIHHIKSLIILKTSSINTQKDHFLRALNWCHRSS